MKLARARPRQSRSGPCPAGRPGRSSGAIRWASRGTKSRPLKRSELRNTTVRAGKFTPAATVEVAKMASSSPSLIRVSRTSFQAGSWPLWWAPTARCSRSQRWRWCWMCGLTASQLGHAIASGAAPGLGSWMRFAWQQVQRVVAVGPGFEEEDGRQQVDSSAGPGRMAPKGGSLSRRRRGRGCFLADRAVRRPFYRARAFPSAGVRQQRAAGYPRVQK